MHSYLAEPFDVIDLSHVLVRDIPNHPSHPPFNFVPYLRPGDFQLENGYWGCNELILMSGHSGTHLDSLGHVSRQGVFFGGKGMESHYAGIDGLQVLGIETVAPIVRRGVLIDVAGTRGVPCLDPGEEVSLADVRAALDRSGAEITAGDCVLVRTGWASAWSDPARYLGSDSGVPGIGVEVANWLGERRCMLVGSDTPTVEVTNPGMHSLPVHLNLLAERGIHLLENSVLDDLAERSPKEFLFVCLPLKIAGASGSPVRPVALVSIS